MKKIVILGSSSMAGHIITDYFENKKTFKVISINEEQIFNDKLDINKSALPEKADIVINSIRCLVDESSSYPEKAIIYNSYLPQFLFNLYSNDRTKIIQLSTDCVFSGKEGNYSEDHQHDGSSIYSKSRSLGESYNNKDIIIRTSYIGPTLGNDREELFDWFLCQKDSVNGYSNALWNGITTLELAKNIFKLIDLNFSGVYHITGEKKISKLMLLEIIKEIWEKKIIINNDNSLKIDRSLVDTKNLLEPLNYITMFKQLYNYMIKRKSIYKKYNLDN